jgi:predicted DNA-binding transcriptional regulator
MASVRVPRCQASVSSSVLKTPALKESLQWLGIDGLKVLPLRETTYLQLIATVKHEKRPVTSNELACNLDLASRTVRSHLLQLSRDGRAKWISGKGWIPLR